MNENKDIPFKVTVDTAGGEKSLAQLRNEFKQYDTALGNAKAGTKEFTDALTALGRTKGQITELRNQINALNPEARGKALGNIGSTIAGGFQAATGAAALFGTKAEDVQKILLRVQAATAFAQGIQSITQLGDEFKIMKLIAVDALNGVSKALIATGIGAFVVALGVIVAYWDDIKKLVSGVSAEQEKLLASEQKSVKASQDKLDAISKEENVLRLTGKSEREILNMKIQASEVTLQDLKAQIITQEGIEQAQIKAAERNHQILTGLLKFVSLPITAVLEGIDAISNALGRKSSLSKDFFGSIANMVFSPEDVKKKGDETIKELKGKLTEIENAQAGFKLGVQAIDKKADEESTKRKQSQVEGEKYLEELLTKAVIDEDKKKTKSAEDEAKIQADLLDKSIADGLSKYEKDAADKIRLDQFVTNTKIQLEQQAFSSVKGLADTFFGNALARARGNAAEELKIKRNQFRVEKSLNAGQTAMNTATAIMKIMSQGGIYATPLAIATGVLGAVQQAAILARQFDDGGASSTEPPSFAGGSAPSIDPPQSQQQQVVATQTNTNAQGDFTSFQKPLRAYVVETEFSAVQTNVKNIEERSKY